MSAVTRLTDMGLARHMIAATLKMSVAQRLVRGLCPQCRAGYALDASTAAVLGRPDLEGKIVYGARGCLECGRRRSRAGCRRFWTMA